MSGKEAWNIIIHSRTIWPEDHILHNLDLFVLVAVMFYGVLWLAWFADRKTIKQREPKEDLYSYERWCRLHRESTYQHQRKK